MFVMPKRRLNSVMISCLKNRSRTIRKNVTKFLRNKKIRKEGIEKLLSASEKGPYGRCVFKCDNDVVDHQIVTMQFENGVKAELTMTAFTRRGGSRYHFFGPYGEIILEMDTELITVNRFGEETERI